MIEIKVSTGRLLVDGNYICSEGLKVRQDNLYGEDLLEAIEFNSAVDGLKSLILAKTLAELRAFNTDGKSK